MAALESWYSHNTGTTPINLSEQQLVDCDSDNYGCNGGWPWKSLRHLANNGGGAVAEADYPYNGRDNSCNVDVSKAKIKPNTSKGYIYVKPNNEDHLEALDHSTLSVCLDAYLL